MGVRVTQCSPPPYKWIVCHGIDSMTLIRVGDMYNVCPLSWIGTPGISSLGSYNIWHRVKIIVIYPKNKNQMISTFGPSSVSWFFVLFVSLFVFHNSFIYFLIFFKELWVEMCLSIMKFKLFYFLHAYWQWKLFFFMD